MIKRLFLLKIVLFCSAWLYAGDVATFVNLGFSENSQYFLFGQYGIQTQDSKAYAEIYAVDVAENKFLPNGVRTKVYDEHIQYGQEGIGALFNLLSESTNLLSRYGFNHLFTGRKIYLFINGDTPKERIQFRDFYTERTFDVRLIQQTFGSERDVKTQFHISLTVKEKDGKTESYIIGLPNFRREGVKQYWIRQAFLTPDENGMIFVVEKDEINRHGKKVRYMVETVRFR